MNYNNLSPKELVNYLDLHSEDPVVRRLIELLQEGSIVGELVEAGMDPNFNTFKDDWQDYSPGAYIEHLRSDLDYYVRESDELQSQVYDLEKEITRLSTTSLVKFIADVHGQLESAKMSEQRAVNKAETERKLRKEAEQKFEFWEKLNHGVK